MLPAFGAGTNDAPHPRRLREPIEAIRAGDLVLTQDTASGALAFTPVLMVHHAGRQLVKTVSIGGSLIVATDLERFWVAGKGWAMLLDLKVGDGIRSSGRRCASRPRRRRRRPAHLSRIGNARPRDHRGQARNAGTR